MPKVNTFAVAHLRTHSSLAPILLLAMVQGTNTAQKKTTTGATTTQLQGLAPVVVRKREEKKTNPAQSTRTHDARRTAKLIQGPGGQRKLGDLSRAEGATVALHRPQFFGVKDLVRGIERAVDAGGGQAQILDSVTGELKKLLANPKAIDDALVRTSDERYTRTLLHRDPQQRFIVLLLAWTPGQASPIHDHECWGAVGVYRGALAETRYDFNAKGSLEAGATQLAPKGTVTTVDPPDHDLHTMSNPSREVTLTIHIYGRDMTEANVYDAKTGEKTRKKISVDYVA